MLGFCSSRVNGYLQRLLPFVWLLLVMLPLPVHSQVTSSPTTAESMPYIVLENGRVLRGELHRDGSNAVIVIANGGTMRLPVARIRVVAASLGEAYRLQRQSLPAKDITAHVEICEWCLRQKLYREATELIPVLRQMRLASARLESIERRIHSGIEAEVRRVNQRFTAAATPSVSTSSKPASGSNESSQEIVDSVSLETRFVFRQHVLPMLLTRCAAGGCHGKVGNGLLVLRPPSRRAMSRRLAERNLALVGAFIAESPEPHTRLWQMAISEHGKASNPLKDSGIAARKLQAWIEMWKSEPGIARHLGKTGESADDPMTVASTDRKSVSRKQPVEKKTIPSSDPVGDPYDPATFNAGVGRQSR